MSTYETYRYTPEAIEKALEEERKRREREAQQEYAELSEEAEKKVRQKFEAQWRQLRASQKQKFESLLLSERRRFQREYYRRYRRHPSYREIRAWETQERQRFQKALPQEKEKAYKLFVEGLTKLPEGATYGIITEKEGELSLEYYRPPETLTGQLQEWISGHRLEYTLFSPVWKWMGQEVPSFEEWKVKHVPEYVGKPVGDIGLEATLGIVWLAEATLGEVEEHILRTPTPRRELATPEQLGLAYGTIVAGIVVGRYGGRAYQYIKGKVKAPLERTYLQILKKVSPERYYWKRMQEYYLLPPKEPTEAPFTMLMKTKRGWVKQPLKNLNELIVAKGKTTWKPALRRGKPVTPFKTTLRKAYWTPTKEVVAGKQLSLVGKQLIMTQPIARTQPVAKVFIPPLYALFTKPSEIMEKKEVVKPKEVAVPNLVRYMGKPYPHIQMAKPLLRERELQKQARTSLLKHLLGEGQAQRVGVAQTQLFRQSQVQKQVFQMQPTRRQRRVVRKRRKPKKGLPISWYGYTIIHPLPTESQVMNYVMGKKRK